jgi:hypothetical protein
VVLDNSRYELHCIGESNVPTVPRFFVLAFPRLSGMAFSTSSLESIFSEEQKRWSAIVFAAGSFMGGAFSESLEGCMVGLRIRRRYRLVR